MKDSDLDDLVSSKEIESYVYDDVDDVNMYGKPSYYERLVIVLPSGNKIMIHGNKDGDLSIETIIK